MDPYTDKFFTYLCTIEASKGQIVRDFLDDHSNIEILECYIGIKPWIYIIFQWTETCNGAGIGVVLISTNNTPMTILFEIQLVCSNNEAEYGALILGLETLLNLGAKHVLIRGYFELVINQLTHKFKCIKSNLPKFFSYASKLLAQFDKFEFEHMFREKNRETNDLA